MNVCAQARVVRKIPANMVWVLIDHYVVTVPEPVTAIVKVKRRDGEIETAKPEPTRPSADQAPAMVWTEAALEMAMFPGVIDVKAGIIASLVMANPLAVPMDMRSLGMAFVIAEGCLRTSFVRCFARSTVKGLRTAPRSVAAPEIMATTVGTVLSP